MVAISVWPTDAADGAVTSEARWRQMARFWAPTGVVQLDNQWFATLVGSVLTVGSGSAWVDGHFCENLSPITLTTTSNGLAVVRFTKATNVAEVVWRDAATTLQRNSSVWELALWRRTAGVLEDMRVYVTAQPQAVASAAARAVNWPIAGSIEQGVRIWDMADQEWFQATGSGASAWTTDRRHAYAQITADSGTVTSTPTIIPGLQVNLDVPPGHRVLIQTGGTMGQTSVRGTINQQITRDGSQVGGKFITVAPAEYAPLDVSALIEPTAGNHLYSVLMSSSAGGVFATATAPYPAWILAQDIGPA
jgi:hypothetical protein